MNANDRNPDCEHFELLISCGIDGELTGDERLELSRHLDECSSCRVRSVKFKKVNELAGQLGILDDATCTKVVVPVTIKSGSVGNPDRPGHWYRFVPYAALVGLAAGLVVWIGAFLPDSKHADASEVVVPLVSLMQINSTRQEDHEFFRESLELDLRTLKLQIDALENQDQRAHFRERYQRLLQRIKEI